MIHAIEELDQLLFFSKSDRFSQKIVLWYQKNKETYPWREMWKLHQDPYHVWLSEIMLQQTVIKAVLPKYIEFLRSFPNLTALARASEEEIRPKIAGLGYYRRFNLLHKAAKELTNNGKLKKIHWPQTFDEWKGISGVGDYTAAAISSIAFNQAAAVVDGNVERVMCRLFDIRLAPNLPQLKKIFFKTLTKEICHINPGDFNQGMMELGQKICTISSPKCPQCPVSRLCQSLKNKSQHLAPAAKVKKASSVLFLQMLFIKKQNKVFICKRPKNAKFLNDVIGFPTFIEHVYDGENWNLGDIIKSKQTMGSFSHVITTHKLKVEIVYGVLKNKDILQAGEWVDTTELDDKLLSSLDRKVVNFIL